MPLIEEFCVSDSDLKKCFYYKKFYEEVSEYNNVPMMLGSFRTDEVKFA